MLALSLLLLPAAAAQAAQITGDPLSVSSADEDGRLGVAFTGSPTAEFFGSFSSPDGSVSPARSAGFVAVTVDGNGSVQRYGSRWGNVTPTGAAVTGTGTAADPFLMVQTWNGGSELELKQELTYVNGQNSFRAKLDVRNLTGGALQLRASMGADLAGGGSDTGTGIGEPGPPRFIGGFNTTVGSVVGLFEITPWSHYEEGSYSAVLSRADSEPSEGSLLDRTEPTEVDNGAAVQWDGPGLGPGGTATFETGWRFSRTFGLSPERADLTTGDIATFQVESRNSDGSPQAGVPIRYTVSGINSTSGAVPTGADGSAKFEYIGANPGSDTVSVYADQNNNGQRDDGEPQREAQVTWTGLEAPTFAKEVNLKPVSGTVLVRVPRSAKVKGKWAHAAQSKFVRLTTQSQVPVGAEMDTTRGRVQLTASTNKADDPVATSQFYSGRFQATQRTRDRGLTEVKLTEPLKCQPNSKGKVTSSARRSRRLWGSGRGKFRTRGRNSSATVRGTVWLTKDTCKATSTTVKEGVVIVRDFAKRKNVRVKAPKTYTARARKR